MSGGYKSVGGLLGAERSGWQGRPSLQRRQGHLPLPSPFPPSSAAPGGGGGGPERMDRGTADGSCAPPQTLRAYWLHRMPPHCKGREGWGGGWGGRSMTSYFLPALCTDCLLCTRAIAQSSFGGGGGGGQRGRGGGWGGAQNVVPSAACEDVRPKAQGNLLGPGVIYWGPA